MRTAELKQKEVINIVTAERIGFISDVEMDFEKGCVESLIIPVKRGISGIFGKKQDVIISWENIVSVGRDLVLVQTETTDIVR